MRGENIVINKIAKIASIALALVMIFTIAIGCKTVEPEEEASVETREEAPVETTEEEVSEEEEKEEAVAEEPETVTITDSSGREVTIKKPVESIVSAFYTMSEALKIINAWDRVVGIDSNISDPILYPNIEELPAITEPMNAYGVNYEKVFELHPDILLTAYIPMPGFDDVVANLEPEIPVIALNLHEPATIVENFRKLGLILDREEEVEEFLEFYKRVEADILAVTSNIPDEDKPRLFYKTGWGDVADLMTFSDDMPGVPYRYELTGSINIAADLPSQGGWVMAVDPEWLIEQDPDFVICGDPFPGIFGLGIDDTSAAEARRNEIMKLDVFSGGSAVKNGNVYVTAPDFFGTPEYIIGLAYQAKWFHPDLFTDLDPKVIHQEYLTKFMRIDYDLEKHGVFVYPEP